MCSAALPTRQTPTRRGARRIAAAASLGTLIEWYDFFLYGTASALILPKLFFPEQSGAVGALLSFATFAVGFVIRPLGGVVFGHLGDRLGRKNVLVATLVLMGAATVGIGLLPTYGQIGGAAPILLVLLRLVQGFATGGEWSGAALMTKENGSSRHGLFGSFLSSAAFGGLVFGSLAFTALAGLLSDAQLFGWGWRIPFLISIVLVGVGLWMRRNLPEKAEFEHGRRS